MHACPPCVRAVTFVALSTLPVLSALPALPAAIGLVAAGVGVHVSAAEAEGLTTSTVSRKLRLARLAPDLIEQILLGQQPRRLTLFWLLRHDIPALWAEQRQVLDQFK